ncbi:protein ITPRID2 [Antennarius striatus]|uniref:protein ITPRID2 n=1 Tax=Antennarius striatus TaxID=241820 RepID=UPI0035AF60EA
MDILNLWNDDPEELLLDLGFGTDEHELSGRIPVRFINHPSQARGIDLQVFLESQKNCFDLENPQVSSCFRQLEVFQQVTTAFTSLMGSSCSPVNIPQGKDLLPNSPERRKHIGMMFRGATKKLEEIVKPTGDGLQEMVCLSGLNGASDQEADPGPNSQSHMDTFAITEEAVRPCPMSKGYPIIANKERIVTIDKALEDLSTRSIFSRWTLQHLSVLCSLGQTFSFFNITISPRSFHIKLPICGNTE